MNRLSKYFLIFVLLYISVFARQALANNEYVKVEDLRIRVEKKDVDNKVKAATKKRKCRIITVEGGRKKKVCKLVRVQKDREDIIERVGKDGQIKQINVEDLNLQKTAVITERKTRVVDFYPKLKLKLKTDTYYENWNLYPGTDNAEERSRFTMNNSFYANLEVWKNLSMDFKVKFKEIGVSGHWDDYDGSLKYFENLALYSEIFKLKVDVKNFQAYVGQLNINVVEFEKHSTPLFLDEILKKDLALHGRFGAGGSVSFDKDFKDGKMKSLKGKIGVTAFKKYYKFGDNYLFASSLITNRPDVTHSGVAGDTDDFSSWNIFAEGSFDFQQGELFYYLSYLHHAIDASKVDPSQNNAYITKDNKISYDGAPEFGRSISVALGSRTKFKKDLDFEVFFEYVDQKDTLDREYEVNSYYWNKKFFYGSMKIDRKDTGFLNLAYFRKKLLLDSEGITDNVVSDNYEFTLGVNLAKLSMPYVTLIGSYLVQNKTENFGGVSTEVKENRIGFGVRTIFEKSFSR